MFQQKKWNSLFPLNVFFTHDMRVGFVDVDLLVAIASFYYAFYSGTFRENGSSIVELQNTLQSLFVVTCKTYAQKLSNWLTPCSMFFFLFQIHHSKLEF